MKIQHDSPFMEFMNTTANFIALNVVFLLTCIPVITVGPAIAALYQVLMREARGEHGYLIRPYFRFFKEMFIQGILTFLLYMGIGLVMIYSFFFWRSIDGYTSIVICVLLALAFIFLICSMIYVFPLMARFKNSFGQTIKNANILTLASGKYTAILLISVLFIGGIIYLFSAVRIFMLVIGFAFCTYCLAFLFVKIFKKYEPKDENCVEGTEENEINDNLKYHISSV
ncbi:MAG: YesL family protein [Wujia sp.]